MLQPGAPRESPRSAPTAVTPSGKAAPVHKPGGASSRSGRPAPSPPAHGRGGRNAALASRLISTPRENVGKGKVRHTAPRGSCPRCLEWVWGPEKLGPAEAPACRPPHARPGRLRLREPSRCLAPHSPLTLARAAEPGSGSPGGCRMPSGRARRGDLVPGSRPARGAAEDSAGGGGAPPFQQPQRRVQSPRKVWRREGWR